MKRFLTGVSLSAATGMAGAHTLAPDETLVTQLQHELWGAHHLPITLLLLAVGLFMIWRLAQRSTR